MLNQVLLVNSRQVVGHVKSFEPKFIGPFVIRRKINQVNYEITSLVNSKTQIVHYNRMIKYNSRNLTSSFKNLVSLDVEDEWRLVRSKAAVFVNSQASRKEKLSLDQENPQVNEPDGNEDQEVIVNNTMVASSSNPNTSKTTDDLNISKTFKNHNVNTSLL